MINKLVDKIKKTNAPIVVGLDPMLSYVPEHIQKKAFEEYTPKAVVIVSLYGMPATMDKLIKIHTIVHRL